MPGPSTTRKPAVILRRVEVDQAHQCHGNPRIGQGSGETSYRPVGLLAEELSV